MSIISTSVVQEGSRLVFSPTFSSAKYELFEVSEELYKHLSGSSRVSVKGKENEEAVICSDSRTWSVKLVDSTNTLLLLPLPSTSLSVTTTATANIVASLSRHYELVEIVPKLHQLKSILSERLYSGQENEQKQKGKLVTFDQLKARIQASEKEIIAGLRSLNAFELDGHWRLMASDYMDDIIELILTEVVSSDWDLAKISEKQCVEALYQANYEPWCIAHVLSVYCEQATQNGQDKLYNLDKRKICLFHAIKLLKTAKEWQLSVFMNKWKDTLSHQGIDLEPSADILHGTAVIIDGTQPSVMLFPADDLNNDPMLRFKQLFEKKKNWSLAEIKPYIRDLVPPTQNVEQFLLRYSRAIQVANGVVYGPK